MIFIVNADNKFNLCLITKQFTVLILCLEITIQTRVKLYLRVLKYKLLAYIDSYSMLMYFVFFILLYFLFFILMALFRMNLCQSFSFLPQCVPKENLWEWVAHIFCRPDAISVTHPRCIKVLSGILSQVCADCRNLFSNNWKNSSPRNLIMSVWCKIVSSNQFTGFV